MTRIAIFASGSGTNAEHIATYFERSDNARVHLILCNKAGAGVVSRAARLKIPCQVFSAGDLSDGLVLEKLLEEKIDFIVLAGFLLLMPPSIIKVFEGRIINIHPALLPAHGGKGFYGNGVHRAVIESGAIMSGITIHHVNEKYDEGSIIFQSACHVKKNETPESLAEKIHSLEYMFYPRIIDKMINGLPKTE